MVFFQEFKFFLVLLLEFLDFGLRVVFKAFKYLIEFLLRIIGGFIGSVPCGLYSLIQCPDGLCAGGLHVFDIDSCL